MTENISIQQLPYIYCYSPTSRRINVSGGIFFNNQELSNDLEGGNLKGNVVFAQASTFPARPATDPRDIRPHLVSLRDTLVLFKPLDETFDSALPLKMLVFNKNVELVYEQTMLPPDQLPSVAEQNTNNGEEFLFLEPETYDKTVNGIVEFNNIVEQIRDHTTIKVEVSDDVWTENVSLPNIEMQDDTLSMVTFSSTSLKPFNVNYGNNTMKIKPNGKMIFFHIGGKWENMYESALYENADIIKNFIINNKAAPVKVIKGMSWVQEFGEDSDGSAIAKNMSAFGNIHVIKKGWYYPAAIHLPKNNASFHNNFVIFSTIGSKAPLVIHHDDSTTTLTKDDSQIFWNQNGKWLEWPGALFGAIKYGDNFWNARIPKEHVEPEMLLMFQNGDARGHMYVDDVGAPTELVLHNIDIGMLVEPRGELYFANNTECQRSYFQTIPVSRLIVTEYEPVHFKEIVLSDNTTYTTHSSDEGGTFGGDMRRHIAKSLVSTGITMANYGIHSTFGPSTSGPASPYFRTANWFTIFNSRGNYSNGVRSHGLTGGGAVVTIFKTCYPNQNEQSHEIGHHWAGHYPGGINGSVHRPSEYFGSSWGWNSDFNLFLPNFQKGVTREPSCVPKEDKATGVITYKCQESFFGHQFGRDAMAGGGGAMYPSISYFTMHTPYMMYSIQNGNATDEEGTNKAGKAKGLENYANWDKNSKTGLVRWDSDCKCMKEWSVTPVERGNKNPKKDTRNLEDLPRVPEEQGVAVATLVGFYDPELTMRTYIYPALHGSYGNVFPSSTEEEINNLSEKACYASVINEKGEEKKFALKDVRSAGENEYKKTGQNMNKFHINVAETFEPTNMKIYCRGQLITERNLSKPTKTLNYNVFGNPL